MEMQGKPIGNTPTGTKNTSVPAPPIQEGPGAIAKDSLAAESSAFDDKYTQDVEGGSSTFNNTDTSGAKVLPSARDATDRLPSEVNDNVASTSGEKYPEAAGKEDLKGQHSDHGYARGPSSGDNTSSSGSGSGSGAYSTSGLSEAHSGSGSGSSAADTAPTVYSTGQHQDSNKPKGTNITEGGFDSSDNVPNASFTSEIGTDQDPGRRAELDMQKHSAGDAADSGMSKTQKDLDTEHPYQKLDTEEGL